MQAVLFYIVYPLVWLLSKLPFRVLYVLSDVLFLLIFYIFNYRKKVVFNNIKTVFPHLSDKEINKLSKVFFQHFIDVMMESIKSLTISTNEITKRYHFKNPELVNFYAKQGKSIALVGAHLGNWEWSISLPLATHITCFGTYTKLENPYFNRVVKDLREKFGMVVIKTTETVKNLAENHKNKIQGMYLLLSDQSPQLGKTQYWSHFLGVHVPCHTGAELLSKKFDLVVINFVAKKVKRGFYEIDFELITDNPKSVDNFKITEDYLELTKKNIYLQPEYYLWSHKRFKHKDKYDEWLEHYAPKRKTNV